MASSSTYTRQQYASALLAAIGNTMPTPYTLQWVICWTTYETQWPNSASYNLLNTTQPETGSYGGGSQGNIQYYPDFQTGIQGAADTLKNGNYANLLQALQFNDEPGLQEPDAGTVGIGANLNTWGTGHAQDIANCANQALLSGSNQGQQSFSSSYNSNGQQTNTGSGTVTAGVSFDPFSGWLQSMQPFLTWLSDPMRVLKLLMGYVLVGIALYMLVAPPGTTGDILGSVTHV